MSTPDKKNEPSGSWWNEQAEHSRSGRIIAGLILVIVGAGWLANQFGDFFPDWLISWPMILIVVGLFTGAKHGFRGIGWMFPTIIGLFFLVDFAYPEFSFRPYFWPLFLILMGLYFIVRPKRKKKDMRGHWGESLYGASLESGDWVDYTSFFGGIKKNVISKEFKGGEVTAVFGGAEVNLSQADITGTVNLDLTAVFGGVKLIVPPHWQIRSSDFTTVMGGVEDKRQVYKDAAAQLSDKVLNLTGTAVLGGIDIRSY